MKVSWHWKTFESDCPSAEMFSQSLDMCASIIKTKNAGPTLKLQDRSLESLQRQWHFLTMRKCCGLLNWRAMNTRTSQCRLSWTSTIANRPKQVGFGSNVTFQYAYWPQRSYGMVMSWI